MIRQETWEKYHVIAQEVLQKHLKGIIVSNEVEVNDNDIYDIIKQAYDKGHLSAYPIALHLCQFIF